MSGRDRIAVAAPHAVAVEAAREVVELGGGALDAALAASAALTVAYPHQCSIGGDLVALVRDPVGRGGEVRAVLSVGAAAAGIDVAALRAAGPRMPAGGPQTVTVPGVVAGWAAVAGLGARLPLADLLAPAIRIAVEGVAVSPGLARATASRLDVVRADAGLGALLLDAHGRPKPVGARLHQPELAGSLADVAADWQDFYRSPVAGGLADRLVTGLARMGSPLAADDLCAHRADVVEPLQAQVGDLTWWVAPPPSQGASLLAVLTVAGDRVAVAHEAARQRDALLGDPRRGPIDLDALLLRSSSAAAAAGTGPRPAGDTVAVTAVSCDGTAVSLIQSVFQSFGSGLLEPQTGIVLHNRGSAFSLDLDHPGALLPGVRPPHTLCPALCTGEEIVVALGCQGGRAQPWILGQVAPDLAAGREPSEVLARPRWVIGSRDLGRSAPSMVMEPGVPASLAATADDLGLHVVHLEEMHDEAGHVQVSSLRRGQLAAASDPRADGTAAVLAG